MSERGEIQDIDNRLGDDVSRMLYEASKLTHENRPGLVEEYHESFSGFRAMSLGRLGLGIPNEDLMIYMDLDGVGTKVEVSERMADHSVVAYDLFAMACDDAAVRGGESVALGSILDVRRLDDSKATKLAVQQLANGYVGAAKDAGVVVINGEVAQLGDRIGGYGEFNYNWGASVLWLAHKDRILTGKEVQPDDVLIGLHEHGFRSNGLTGVRRLMLETYGSDWHRQIAPELGQVSLGELVQKPSIIYSKVITELTGGYDITQEPKADVHAVAHITGGGQPGKLGRILEPSGLGVEIDTPLEQPAIMRHVQDIGDISDKKAYEDWHMGPGMVVVASRSDAEKVIVVAANHGVSASVIGRVTEEPGIRIKNVGVQREEEFLEF